MKIFNRHITPLKTFFNYLKNRLSNQERNAFERKMMQDAFEQEAYEGFMPYDEETINADLHHLKQRLSRRKKDRFLYLKIAASVLVVVSISVLLFQIQFDDQKLLSDNRTKKTPVEEKTVEAPVKVEEEAPAEILEIEEAPVIKQEPSPVKKAIKTRSKVEVKPEVQSAVTDEVPTPVVEEVAEEPMQIAQNIETEVEEVKVVGYAVQKKRDVTGAVSTIAAEDIKTSKECSASKRRRLAKTQLAEKPSAIKGVVLDETGNPLPGVNVIIKGTDESTITDLDGNYELANVDSTAIIEYAFIGYETQETKAGEAGGEVQLEPSLMAMDEVVVVGYGTVSKEQESSYTQAKPQGGFSEYKKYIAEHLIHPDSTADKKQVVTLKLTIETSGNISNFEVVKSPGEAYTQEAIRVIKSAPQWIPAQRNGSNEQSTVRIRVVFKPLQDK